MKTKALIFVALLSLLAGSSGAQQLSGIGGGGSSGGTCSTCTLKANNGSDFSSASTTLTNLGGAPAGIVSIVTSSPATVTVAQWAACTAFVPNAGSLTVTLALSSTYSSNGCIVLSTINAVTLALANGADKINGGSAGVSLSVAANQSVIVTTDAAGNFYAAQGTSGLSSPITTAVIDSTGGAASTPAWKWTGALYKAGDGTTNTPLHYWLDPGATTVTSWDANGTIYGTDAHTSCGKWADHYIDNVEKFYLGCDGSFYFSNGGQAKNLQITNGQYLGFVSATLAASDSDGSWTFERNAATTFDQLNLGRDNAVPTAVTIRSNGVVAGTSNTASVATIIKSGPSTGTGAAGEIDLETTHAGTTGTAQNSYTKDFAVTGHGLLTAGTIPVVTGTGSPTIVLDSTDTAGEVTGGTSATSIVITFSETKAKAPFCTVDPQDQKASFTYAISTTAITITQTATTGTKVDYHCFQH